MPDLATSFRAVTEMSTGAATVAIVIALALGWYGARWLQAERDEISLRARLSAAIRVMWQSRRALVAVVIIAFVAFDLWSRGKGR
jgi:chromate transport protein ChrA